ncbi:hypothetical protein N7523_006595 [Penicillium sp. IBT 18751x]|nr:hypothetical protein N7523_006595 [Penicillium sp. IBT 18751x]
MRQVSHESNGFKIAHAPAGSRPNKHRDRPALYDTTFAPGELESQRRVTASFLHSITRPGGEVRQDCALPRATTKHIATSDLQEAEGGERSTVIGYLLFP